jgi:serine/threonine protein kinase
MHDGHVIAGKYRLISKLGEGGLGVVWRAQHLELNCPAAVTLLDPAFAESPEALARFKREAEAAASLRSTNSVRIREQSAISARNFRGTLTSRQGGKLGAQHGHRAP